MREKSKRTNRTLKQIVVYVGLTVLIVIGGFQLIKHFFPDVINKQVDQIKKELGIYHRKEVIDIEQTIDYDQFIMYRDQLLQKLDKIKKLRNDADDYTQLEVSAALFLLNHDELTEEAVKRLMNEEIIKKSSEDCLYPFALMTELINRINEEKIINPLESTIEVELNYSDFCMGEGNKNFANYLIEYSKNGDNFQEFYDYIMNSGLLSSYAYDGMNSIQNIKFDDLPIEYRMLLYGSYFNMMDRFKEHSPDFDQEKLDQIDEKFNDFNILKESKYNRWF